MNLLQNASDDQLALIGCVVALACSMGLMYVSYFIGQAMKSTGVDDVRSQTHPFPGPREQISADQPKERAA